MEAAASVAVAARGVSMTMPSSQSQSSRQEWRVVSDHQVENSGNEDLDRSKLGQGDERLIYEVQQGRDSVDVDFFPITVDGSSDHELRLDDVVKQREQLQHLEVNLKARLIARSEVMELQERFDSQMKDHIAANVKLQEQLHEREKTVHDLQKTLEDKEKELHAIRLDHEAAWAKEDLLREQNKEIATFRRERDNSEAERAQHIKQIHELQEHIQEKERQFMEMQEQHRVAQDTIIFKDEQIREAHAWIARVQEMDAMHSTTNHSLQAELRERTEQYNQLWLGYQRQFAEMERVHLHTLQQLQLELAEARERSGTYSGESRTNLTNLKDTSNFGHSNGSQVEASGGSTLAGNSGGHPNGNAETVSSFAPTGSASTQPDQIPAVQISPQSVHEMQTYLSPGQLTALHPLVMHQQGVSQNVNSHLVHSHVGQFHSVPANSSLSHWQNQQASSDGSHVPNHEHYPSQNDQNALRQETNYDYEASVKGQEGQDICSGYLDVHISQGLESQSVVPAPNVEGQVLEPIDNSYMVNPQSKQSLQQISSQFQSTLRLNPSDHENGQKAKNANTLSTHGDGGQTSDTEQLSSASNASDASLLVKFSESTANKVAGATAPEGFVSTGKKSSSLVGKTPDPALLDEASLLACVVRSVPPGPDGYIRISTTLTTRLVKMLTPLCWSDYTNEYGELDEFLRSHPELFFIEDDHIKVREGAQEIIAAMAARAKVRAAAVAAAATSSHSSLVPSVAVTPMAQSRPKKAPSISSHTVKAERSMLNEPQLMAMQNQRPNGVSFNSVGGVRILSKHNDQMELNGPETRPGQASILFANGNGTNLKRAGLSSSQSKVINHARPSSNFSGKQLGRSSGALPSSRR